MGCSFGAHVFAGRPTPTPEPEAFKLVAALDLTIMMPALASGGVLLWRRQAWGYLIASIAAIQGALYLLVSSVGSAVSISRGQAPGQLPIWGSLAVSTAAAAALLLVNVRARGDGTIRSGADRRAPPAVGA